MLSVVKCISSIQNGLHVYSSALEFKVRPRWGRMFVFFLCYKHMTSSRSGNVFGGKKHCSLPLVSERGVSGSAFLTRKRICNINWSSCFYCYKQLTINPSLQTRGRNDVPIRFIYYQHVTSSRSGNVETQNFASLQLILLIIQLPRESSRVVYHP